MKLEYWLDPTDIVQSKFISLLEARDGDSDTRNDLFFELLCEHTDDFLNLLKRFFSTANLSFIDFDGIVYVEVRADFYYVKAALSYNKKNLDLFLSDPNRWDSISVEDRPLCSLLEHCRAKANIQKKRIVIGDRSDFIKRAIAALENK